ncbi:hypothetical protein [Ammoniphilus resinae]|uniref:Hemerythrin superfamily protein n=1 Tax=Ammoniphilus resinae TaxID=861532 RepID=A0ABS4GRR3_9BACL|nr:hypothetical protein [Ammoniphilus resinae]MBP1932968.1 hemerythrin superfamily protein [Ammoniphilus resinae]
MKHDDDLLKYFQIHDKTEIYKRKMEKFKNVDQSKYKRYLAKYLKNLNEENDYYGQLFYPSKKNKNELSFSYRSDKG